MINTKCGKCGSTNGVPSQYIGQSVKCPECGQDYVAAQAHQSTTKNNKTSSSGSSSRSRPWIVAGLVIFIFAIILGKIHIVTGGSVGPKFISRESFGFSEMFINVDKITGMPWISAQTKYPLGCKALAREGIIETDQEFKTRTKQEIQEDIDKITREALEEYDRAMEDLE